MPVQTQSFENVDLTQYPNDITPLGQFDSLIIGDLHGCALKLIWSMIKRGVMEMAPNDYQRLVAIYQKPVELLTPLDCASFFEIINRAKFNNQKVILIGDELADRGNNDLFTLLCIQAMDKANLPFDVLLSNHAIEFLKNFYDGSLQQPTIGLNHEQGASCFNLADMLNNNIMPTDLVNKLVSEHYLPHIKLMSYTGTKEAASNNEIDNAIYTHAPVGLENLIYLAKYYDIAIEGFEEQDAEQIINELKLIEELNQQQIKAIKKCIDAVNEAFQNDIKTTVASYFSSDEAKANAWDLPLENPIARLMWNRINNEGLERLLCPKGFTYIHGHVGDIRRDLQTLGIEVEGIGSSAQSYKTTMRNSDNNLAKAQQTLEGAYHMLVAPNYVTLQQQLDNGDGYDSVDEICSEEEGSDADSNHNQFTAINLLFYQLLENLQSGNILLLSQLIQDIKSIASGDELCAALASVIQHTSADYSQTSALLTYLLANQGVNHGLNDDMLAMFQIEALNSQQQITKEQKLSIALCQYLLVKQIDSNGKQALSCAFNIYGYQLIKLIAGAQLSDVQQTRLIQIVANTMHSESSNENKQLLVLGRVLNNNLSQLINLIQSPADTDKQLVNFIIDKLASIDELSALDKFVALEDWQKQAIIAQLNGLEQWSVANGHSDEHDKQFSQIVTSVINMHSKPNNPSSYWGIPQLFNVTPMKPQQAVMMAKHDSYSGKLTGVQLNKRGLARALFNICNNLLIKNADNLIAKVDVEQYYDFIVAKINKQQHELDSHGDDSVIKYIKGYLSSSVTIEEQAKINLTELAQAMFRTGIENPYRLRGVAGETVNLADVLPDEGTKSVRVTKTMVEMLEQIKLARLGVCSYRQALHQVSLLGQLAFDRHQGNENALTAKTGIYFRAKNLIAEQVIENYNVKYFVYFEELRQKMLTRSWDVHAIAGTRENGHLITKTMKKMINIISKAKSGEVSAEFAYVSIKKLAVQAQCRHTNWGRQQSRTEGKTAPFELYQSIGESKLQTFSIEQANDVLIQIKQDMDKVAVSTNNVARFFSFTVGGKNVNIGNDRVLTVAKHLAKMYKVYHDFKQNPQKAIQALDEIKAIARQAYAHRSMLRTDEMHQFYNNVCSK